MQEIAFKKNPTDWACCCIEFPGILKGAEDNVLAPRHISQMHIANYTPFIRKKAARLKYRQ